MRHWDTNNDILGSDSGVQVLKELLWKGWQESVTDWQFINDIFSELITRDESITRDMHYQRRKRNEDGGKWSSETAYLG